MPDLAPASAVAEAAEAPGAEEDRASIKLVSLIAAE
jgi:hypothetical protein